jgi:hypothetical protein
MKQDILNLCKAAKAFQEASNRLYEQQKSIIQGSADRDSIFGFEFTYDDAYSALSKEVNNVLRDIE